MWSAFNRFVLVTVAVLAGTGAAVGQQAPSAYTAKQAATGRAEYATNCAMCHGDRLQGVFEAPLLTGRNFLNKWGTAPVSDLIKVIQTRMPLQQPGSLNEETTLAIVAYILQSNGVAPGSTPLTKAEARPIGSMRSAQVPAATEAATAASSAAPDAPAVHAGGAPPRPVGPLRPRRLTVSGTVEAYVPVTDAMLKNPDPGDWLMVHRTYQAWSHSPLKQITKENVKKLQLQWVWAMPDVGRNQPTPIVHGGIVYLANAGNIVQALDGKTGELIWEHQLGGEPPNTQSVTRSLALYQDKVIIATHDMKLIALDARTGKVSWETQMADPAKGYMATSGPIVANGTVVQGMTGCERFTEEGCFVGGYDANTGKPLWKFHTAAKSNEPGGDTWGKTPDVFRAGGDPWIAGSYDPDLDLVFQGTSQAKPMLAASRGLTVKDKVLYTNSTLALRPKDGHLAWYFQHVPGETLDMDESLERVLVDIDGRKTLLTVGKHGILWKLDRTTGAFIDYKETVFQNIFKSIDKKTGLATYRDDIANAKVGDKIDVCPSTAGGHSRSAMSYHPGTGLLVIPLSQTCMEFQGRKVDFEEGKGILDGTAVSHHKSPHAGANIGKLAAYDTKTLQQVWSVEQPAIFTASALTTGGDLVFAGDLDRNFRALDVKTGKVVWQTRLGTSVQGYPVSFSVAGKQYIAVPTGVGASAFRRGGINLTPDVHIPPFGSALYVFALPDE